MPADRQPDPVAAKDRHTLYTQAPSTPEGIADDLLYAFAHGLAHLAAATTKGREASERLTRLHAIRAFAKDNYAADHKEADSNG